MKTFFLAKIANQLFAIDKQSVAGVAIRDLNKTKPILEFNRSYLPFTNGQRALICDMQSVLATQFPLIASLSHYVILTWSGKYYAIPMNDSGRLACIHESSWRSLPPVFATHSRQIVPKMMVNGTTCILMADLAGLTAHFTETALQEALAA